MINRRVKNIIVPKDHKSSMLLLESNESQGDYTTLPIPHDDLTLLFTSGLFDVINDELSMLIDDYEEEEILTTADIVRIRPLVAQFSSEDFLVIHYRSLLLQMIDLAIERETGLFFYF